MTQIKIFLSIFALLFFCNFTPIKSNSYIINNKAKKNTNTNFDIQITLTDNYSNKPFEVLYKAICFCKDNSPKRTFEIIKTDSFLKNYFLAEFILVEKSSSKELTYYPFGWENNKIKIEEFRKDCQNILTGTIKPIKIH